MAKNLRKAALLIGASLVTGASMPALARVAPSTSAAGESDINDIVVTARRREESIQSVPVAITAFNGEKLHQLNVSRVDDLRTVTAGLNIQGGAGRQDNPIYLIRGQRATDNASTQDGPVSIYVDDIVVGAAQGTNLGLFDLESVQVLKGPQGTLFGRNTTGGAILYSTAKPKDQFEAGITGGLGNYAQRLVESFVNIPVSETFKVRAAMQYSYHRGFSRIVEGALAGTRLQNRDELSGRITAEFDPASGVKSLTTLYGSRSDTNGGGFILLGYNPVSVAAFFNYKSPSTTRRFYATHAVPTRGEIRAGRVAPGQAGPGHRPAVPEEGRRPARTGPFLTTQPKSPLAGLLPGAHTCSCGLLRSRTLQKVLCMAVESWPSKPGHHGVARGRS